MRAYDLSQGFQTREPWENPTRPASIRKTKIYKQCLFSQYLSYFNHSRSQFHQRFTSDFFVQKSFCQLFSSYILALAKVLKHFCTKNVRVKCWWNWQHPALQSFLTLMRVFSIWSFKATLQCIAKLIEQSKLSRLKFFL